MRLKDLRGLPVIDPTAARKIGTVADYQVDPSSKRLAAVDISGAGDRGGERILAQRIRRVGTNAVMLTARGGSLPGGEPEVNERWLDTSTLIGLEVMGDDGDLIGSVADATFDQDTLEIEAYVLQASLFERLMGRRARIQPEQVHACSRELMIMSTGRVKEADPVEAPAENVSTPLDLRMPLKEADRLPEPTFERVNDGQPVGGKRR